MHKLLSRPASLAERNDQSRPPILVTATKSGRPTCELQLCQNVTQNSRSMTGGELRQKLSYDAQQLLISRACDLDMKVIIIVHRIANATGKINDNK